MLLNNIISESTDSLIRWAAQHQYGEDPSEIIEELTCEALPEEAEEYLDLIWETPSLLTESLENCYSDTLSACDVLRAILYDLIAGELWHCWANIAPDED